MLLQVCCDVDKQVDFYLFIKLNWINRPVSASDNLIVFGSSMFYPGVELIRKLVEDLGTVLVQVSIESLGCKNFLWRFRSPRILFSFDRSEAIGMEMFLFVFRFDVCDGFELRKLFECLHHVVSAFLVYLWTTGRRLWLVQSNEFWTRNFGNFEFRWSENDLKIQIAFVSRARFWTEFSGRIGSGFRKGRIQFFYSAFRSGWMERFSWCRVLFHTRASFKLPLARSSRNRARWPNRFILETDPNAAINRHTR